MKTSIKTFGMTTAAISLALSSTLSASAFADRTLRLDSGTVIPVKLKEAISSDKSHAGDHFQTTVLTSDNEPDYGIPFGTRIEGTIHTARAQEDKNPGVLDVSFDRMILPDGRTVRLTGSLIGLDNKSVEKRSDGRLVAKNGHKNDRLLYTGYGAAAGLIVGIITKHTLEDTVIGGGLGYLFSTLQKGHNDPRNVYLKPGTEMGVRVDNKLSLSVDDSESRSSTFKSQTGSRRRANVNDEVDSNTSSSTSAAARRRKAQEIDDATNTAISHRTRPTTNGDETDAIDENSVSNPDSNRGSEDIGVLVNDKEVRFDSAKPFTNQDGIVMVPAAPVLAAAKVPYTYDSSTKTLSATGTSNRVKITVGSRIAMAGSNRRVRLQAPVVRLNGAVYVPLRYLELATGYDTTFDKGSQTVVLTPVEKL